jgi:Protein of unknown function (DUF2459)
MNWQKIVNLTLFILAVLMGSCAIRIPIEKNITVQVKDQKKSNDGKTVFVFLIADKLHTALVFPYDWLAESGYRYPKNFKSPKGRYRYVDMSWGNKVAYVQKRWLTAGEVFTAFLTPSPSVMEIIPVNGKVEEVCFQQRVFRLEVPVEKGVYLAEFLNHCSQQDCKNCPVIAAKSSWGDGLLADSKHSYYFPRICNIWTAQCLEACGLKMNILRSLTANGIVEQSLNQGFKQISVGVEGYGRKKDSKVP